MRGERVRDVGDGRSGRQRRTWRAVVAGVRDALTALVPATTRSKVPVTVLLDCEGGFQFGAFQAADLRGYQYPPAPAREVFAARQSRDLAEPAAARGVLSSRSSRLRCAVQAGPHAMAGGFNRQTHFGRAGALSRQWPMFVRVQTTTWQGQ